MMVSINLNRNKLNRSTFLIGSLYKKLPHLTKRIVVLLFMVPHKKLTSFVMIYVTLSMRGSHDRVTNNGISIFMASVPELSRQHDEAYSVSS